VVCLPSLLTDWLTNGLAVADLSMGAGARVCAFDDDITITSVDGYVALR
jgi:hypothetical protein